MKWFRVTRQRHCSVCDRPDWCTYTADGLICCMRVQSDKPMRNGGWLHRSNGKPAIPPPSPTPKAIDRADLDQIAEEAQARIGRAGLMALSASLGLTADSLRKLETGRLGNGAVTFPMRDATDKIVGIRLRFPDGTKRAVTGGHEGCFVPRDTIGDMTEETLVCEGPTDTAAAMDAGYAAIGRPSCRGAVEIVCRIVRGRTAIIVSDNDAPGIAGAVALARSMLQHKIACKLIRPIKGKDIRAWHPKRKALAAVIGNTPWVTWESIKC